MPHTIKPAQPPVVRLPSSDLPPVRGHASGPEHQGDQGSTVPETGDRFDGAAAHASARATAINSNETNVTVGVGVHNDVHVDNAVGVTVIHDTHMNGIGLLAAEEDVSAFNWDTILAPRHTLEGLRNAVQEMKAVSAPIANPLLSAYVKSRSPSGDAKLFVLHSQPKGGADVGARVIANEAGKRLFRVKPDEVLRLSLTDDPHYHALLKDALSQIYAHAEKNNGVVLFEGSTKALFDGWRGRESEPTARVAARAALLDAMRTSKAPTVLVTEDYQWGRLGRWSPELGGHMKENVAFGEIPDSDVARQAWAAVEKSFDLSPELKSKLSDILRQAPAFPGEIFEAATRAATRQRGEPITTAALSDAFYSVLETTRGQRFDRAF